MSFNDYCVRAIDLHLVCIDLFVYITLLSVLSILILRLYCLRT